jgi:hypothetical protein
VRFHPVSLTSTKASPSDLVGSALSDPFLSYSAALAGLAGPLHGLANQEVLSFILAMTKEIGNSPSDEKIVEHLWSLLKSGRVIPGYGHAVLRKPDPRFKALQEFGVANPEIAKDPVFKMVDKLYHLAPGVLTEHGKTKSACSATSEGDGTRGSSKPSSAPFPQHADDRVCRPLPQRRLGIRLVALPLWFDWCVARDPAPADLTAVLQPSNTTRSSSVRAQARAALWLLLRKFPQTPGASNLRK